MKFALKVSEYNFIQKNVIEKFKQINVDIYVFGSRAKGNSNQFSDLDLLIKDVRSNVNDEEIKKLRSQIEEFLENSNFPYKVDIVIQSELATSYKDDVLNTEVPWN